MNLTISCNALARITTPQTIKIEGHIKKKNVQVKDHIEHQEMNPTISCKGLEEITTPQTPKIGHIKKKKVQAVKDHINHQQQVLQLLKDNIQHDARLWEPDSLENAFKLARKMESKIMGTRKHTTHNYKDGSVVSPSLPQPIMLTPQ